MRPWLGLAAAVALLAGACHAGSGGPAPSAATSPPTPARPPAAIAAPAPKPAPPAPPAPHEAATVAGADVVAAPAGVDGPEPDKWPAREGAVMATVPMRLVRGLEDVADNPRTFQGMLGDAPPPGLDISLLPPGAWLFGSMAVTKTESVPFAASAGRDAIVFDADRDGRLEPDEGTGAAESWRGFRWFPVSAPVRARMGVTVNEMRMPFRIGIGENMPRFISRPDAHREGVIASGGRRIRIAIIDNTLRCLFSHPGLDQLVVDADGDGAFDTSADSFERYRLGEAFPLGDADAVVTAVGPFGSTLTIAKSPTPSQRKASLRLKSAAPSFTATTIDGKPVDLARLKGQWVLLDFWATWCGPCRNELPHLKALRQKHPDVQIIGISGDDTAEPVAAFTKANGMDWPQVHAQARAIMRIYRVGSFPTSFLIAPDGTIAARDLRGPFIPTQVASLKDALKSKG